MNNNKKNILIGEDNILIAEHLRDIVIDFDYNVVGIFHNKIDIIKGLKTYHPDIALLDINMESRFTGVEIGDYIAKKLHIPFIYITAHSEKHTLEKALNTKPSGYILKPFKEMEVNIAIKLALEKFENKPDEGFITIKDSSTNIKIFYSDIIFIKSDNNYVEVHTKKQKYITRTSLKSIISELDKEIFIKVHRSFIINKNCAIKYSKHTLFLNGISIPVSRKFQEDVKNIFNYK
ncbi:MAG: response regulator transcription factor [Bacteroidales bacterium]|nr:response regulator transcription factor [Bacteroidales bacterium]